MNEPTKTGDEATQVWSEARDLERDAEISRWAEEEARKHLAAGLPFPPLFPPDPPAETP